MKVDELIPLVFLGAVFFALGYLTNYSDVSGFEKANFIANLFVAIGTVSTVFIAKQALGAWKTEQLAKERRKIALDLLLSTKRLIRQFRMMRRYPPRIFEFTVEELGIAENAMDIKPLYHQLDQNYGKFATDLDNCFIEVINNKDKYKIIVSENLKIYNDLAKWAEIFKNELENAHDYYFNKNPAVEIEKCKSILFSKNNSVTNEDDFFGEQLKNIEKNIEGILLPLIEL